MTEADEPNKFVTLDAYQEAHPESLGHMFTLSEAGEAAGVSRDVIKRRRAKGDFPHAVQDDHDVWRIPLADLQAAGFKLNRPGTPLDESKTTPITDARVAELEAQAESLRALLAERERVLAERDRALRIAEGRYEQAEQQLRALMPGRQSPQSPAAGQGGLSQGAPAVAPVEAIVAPDASRVRRRWWRRSV